MSEIKPEKKTEKIINVSLGMIHGNSSKSMPCLG